MWEVISKIVISGMWWLIYVFVLWRKFRLDYGERKMLSLGLLSGGILLGLGWGFKMWLGILAAIVVLWRMGKKATLDIWEIGDTAVLTWSLMTIWISPIFALVFGVGVLVMSTYRRFRWYKSGKPGLAGLLTLAVLGLLLIIYGFKSGFVDQVAGVWLLTGSLVSVYLRR